MSRAHHWEKKRNFIFGDIYSFCVNYIFPSLLRTFLSVFLFFIVVVLGTLVRCVYIPNVIAVPNNGEKSVLNGWMPSNLLFDAYNFGETTVQGDSFGAIFFSLFCYFCLLAPMLMQRGWIHRHRQGYYPFYAPFVRNDRQRQRRPTPGPRQIANGLNASSSRRWSNRIHL